jgi:hypothetical protein
MFTSEGTHEKNQAENTPKKKEARLPLVILSKIFTTSA